MSVRACEECGAERGHLYGCSHGNPEFVGRPAEPARPAEWTQGLDDERLELRYRQVVVPLVLVALWWFSGVGLGAFVERTFAGMWLHELGHASASWLCGYAAIPLPWMTHTAETRSVLTSLVVFAGLLMGTGWGGWRRRPVVAALCGLGLVLALIGHAALSGAAARQVVIFAGDAGAMLYGAVMVCTFFARRGSQLVTGALRWGFVGWGASAMADSLRTWVEARRDFAGIPFGLEDGNPSDATQLVDRYGWAELALINRYLTVGALSYAVVLAALAFAIVEQRARVRELAATARRR